MAQTRELLVFTDLDGTLIDHETYSWTPATEALVALKNAGCGVVLASSKTAAEIEGLRAEMGLEAWPAIVENGAGVLMPHASADADTAAYVTLRKTLNDLPDELRQNFTGFGDLSVQDVADLTGLNKPAAALAKQRAFSEPGLWSGSQEARDRFIATLDDAGVIAQQGGRFLTLSFGGNKADRLSELAQRCGARKTVALGDAPNDSLMIEAADIGIVITNPHGTKLPPLKGEDTGQITRTTLTGPRGWNTAILTLLDTLNIQRT